MGIIYVAVNQINASRNANYRELKQGDECLAGRYAHEISVNGIRERAQEIKQEIATEQARAKPDMARLARLRKIEQCLEGTLAKCR